MSVGAFVGIALTVNAVLFIYSFGKAVLEDLANQIIEQKNIVEDLEECLDETLKQGDELAYELECEVGRTIVTRKWEEHKKKMEMYR